VSWNVLANRRRFSSETLKETDLCSWNRFGDEGVKCLGDALKINQVRHDLHRSDHRSSTLADLVMANNEIRDEGVRHLADALNSNEVR
jgi:hypothetical protein